MNDERQYPSRPVEGHADSVGHSRHYKSRSRQGDIYERTTQDSLADGDRASLRDRIVRATGKDRLRPQYGFQPVQDVFLGEGANAKSALGRSNQSGCQFGTGGEGLDSG